jgi:hypothetical protein
VSGQSRLASFISAIGADVKSLQSQITALSPEASWTYVIATADTPNATTTAVNAAGLVIPALPNGLYEFQALVICTSASLTTGAQVGLANNATGATITARGFGNSGGAAMVQSWLGSSQFPMNIASLNSATIASQYVGADIKGVVRAASMAGTVNVTIKTEIAASSVSVKADSYVRYRRIAN